MNSKIIEFVKKREGKKCDYDGAFGYQCNDLTRQRLKESGLPQYKALGEKGCKYVALEPNKYLVNPLKWVSNDLKNPNQIPKSGDVIIFNKPASTGHIAIVTKSYPGLNQIEIFEQNGQDGSTKGIGGDACRLRNTNYNNVYGWITR